MEMEKENANASEASKSSKFFISTPIHIAAELFVFAILTAFFTIKIRGIYSEINEIKKQLDQIDTATNYKKIISNQAEIKSFTENHIIKLYEEIQELKNSQNKPPYLKTACAPPEVQVPPPTPSIASFAQPVASLFKNFTSNAFNIAIGEEEEKLPEKSSTIEIEEIVNEEELDNELQEEYKAMQLQEQEEVSNTTEIDGGGDKLTDKKSTRKNTKSSRKRNTST